MTDPKIRVASKNRVELLPDVDPDAVRAAIQPQPEPEPVMEIDPDDPDAVWLLGDDPEAQVVRTADRRHVIKRQMLSTGGQFVFGGIVLIVSLGLVIMAITNPSAPYIIPAAIVAPFGVWFFRTRWKRWLGSAPYFYRLLTSLGEDAENVLVEHEQKKRKKYVKQIGDLYEHSRPKDV